ncbi:universal stress protein, partial [Halobellus sp. Atlit-31R]
MSYRTIIVHADASRHAPQRIRIAARLASEHEAHLVGVAAIGISREVFPHGYHAARGSLEASYFDPLQETAT